MSLLLVCAIYSLLSRVRHPCTRSPRSSCAGRDTRAARGGAVRLVRRRARRRSVGPSRNSRPKWMPQSKLLQTPSVPQHRFDSRPRSPRIPQLRSALGRLSLSRLRRRARSRHRHRRRIDMSHSYYEFKISPSRLLAELRTSSSVSPLRRLLLAVSSVAVKDRDRTHDSVSWGRAARLIINETFRLEDSVGPGPVGDSGTSSVLATYTVFNN